MVDPRVDAPRYEPLRPGDPLYPLAARLRTSVEGLPLAERRNWLANLAQAWPKAAAGGTPRRSEGVAYQMLADSLSGYSEHQIAEAHHYSPAGVRAKLRETLAAVKSGTNADLRIDVEPPDAEPRLAGYWAWLSADGTRARQLSAAKERSDALRAQIPCRGYGAECACSACREKVEAVLNSAAGRLPAAPIRRLLEHESASVGAGVLPLHDRLEVKRARVDSILKMKQATVGYDLAERLAIQLGRDVKELY